MDKKEYKLNENVAKGYDLAPDAPAEFYHHEVGFVDINTVSVAKVERLIAAGCTNFIKKAPSKIAEVKS